MNLSNEHTYYLIAFLLAFCLGFLVFNNQIILNQIGKQCQNCQYENPRTR